LEHFRHVLASSHFPLSKYYREPISLTVTQLDIQDLDALPQNLSEILAKFPNIDSVIINVGIQQYLNFSPEPFLSSIPQNKGTPSTTAITTEINTNLTGPVILARLIASHFLSTAPLKPATIAFVTSGLAYVPVPIFPLYCATKSALHYFVVALRAQLQGTPLSIVEIVPPYVATELDSGHKDVLEEFFKGNMPKGVDAKIYVEGVIRGLEASGEDGKMPKLIGDGFPRKAADAWVEAYAPMAKIFGLEL
jgi:uncharacterized oxidoreductase